MDYRVFNIDSRSKGLTVTSRFDITAYDIPIDIAYRLAVLGITSLCDRHLGNPWNPWKPCKQ